MKVDYCTSSTLVLLDVLHFQGMLKKHGKEALKNTGTLVKDTQKMFQNRSVHVRLILN